MFINSVKFARGCLNYMFISSSLIRFKALVDAKFIMFSVLACIMCFCASTRLFGYLMQPKTAIMLRRCEMTSSEVSMGTEPPKAIHLTAPQECSLAHKSD